MIIQSRVRRRGPAGAVWLRALPLVFTSSLLVSGAGIVLASTAVTVAAATVTCSATRSTTLLVPGASGRCVFRFAETASQAQHQRFTVTLDVDATSTSGRGSGDMASEALLDGRPTGLHVRVSNSARNTFALGTPSCKGTYPSATPCTSSDDAQAVRGGVDVTEWSDTVTMTWWLPRSAGNPYQAGSATITVTAHFNGTPVAPPSPSPSPTSGVLGATTPSTGIGAVPVLGFVLVGIGIGLALVGVTRMRTASHSRRMVP